MLIWCNFSFNEIDQINNTNALNNFHFQNPPIYRQVPAKLLVPTRNPDILPSLYSLQPPTRSQVHALQSECALHVREQSLGIIVVAAGRTFASEASSIVYPGPFALVRQFFCLVSRNRLHELVASVRLFIITLTWKVTKIVVVQFKKAHCTSVNDAAVIFWPVIHPTSQYLPALYLLSPVISTLSSSPMWSLMRT